MVTDANRRRLYVAASRTWGAEEADVLMELLPPTGWNDVARQSDLREVRAELRGEIAEVRGEVAELRGQIGELRGEMGELRGEVRAMLPKLVAANIGSMLAIAALVAAIVRVG